MKIAQIMPEFGLAGAERMAEALSIELKKCGHEIVVISLYDYQTAITENLQNHGIDIIYLGKKRGLDLTMIPKLIRVFRIEKPDVVHTHRYVCEYVIPAAIIANIKTRIHTVHNIADKERLPKKLQKFFYHHCHVLPVGISPIVHSSIVELYKLSADNVPMIYNGIDTQKYLIKNSYQRSEVFRFLHVGRFAEQKNHVNILKAFDLVHKKYPDTSLTMIGTGELYEEIKQMVLEMQLSDSVYLPGQMENLASEYSLYDAFILPSKYEGMPITLIEAMASGMSIAASDVGGIPDMIRHNVNGLLCKSDSDSIAHIMEILYTDVNLREAIGKQALVDSSQFTSNYMASAYISVYNRKNQ